MNKTNRDLLNIWNGSVLQLANAIDGTFDVVLEQADTLKLKVWESNTFKEREIFKDINAPIDTKIIVYNNEGEVFGLYCDEAEILKAIAKLESEME